MTLVPFRERAEFLRGRNGEKLIADWLRRRGWLIVPSYDYSGEDDHAPRMEGLMSAYILPDLDICRSGVRRWAEVKTKFAPTLGRISGELEHGIPLRHYDHYQTVQHESGCQVWLFVYEEQSGAFLYAELDALGRGRHSHSQMMSRGGMVYWLRRQFSEAPVVETRP
jgi:hypothetical protein